MKHFSKLINEVNKEIYLNPTFKEIFKDFIPFKSDLITDKKRQQGIACIVSENLDILPKNIIQILDDILTYDFRKENDNKLKTMYSLKIEDYLNRTTNTKLKAVIDHLNKLNGFTCLVGGCIRDICSDKEPKDFDFVTNLDYDILEKYFVDNYFTVKTTGKHFNVMNLVYPTGESFEIALYRKDGTYVDGRRPDKVSIGNIFEDSQRRDFTVNSLYFDINDSVLMDPTGYGVLDVHNKELRFNGSAKKRIKEDYLRVFRAYRFVGKGFKVDTSTLSTLRNCFEEALTKTASERIRDEIEKMVGI